MSDCPITSLTLGGQHHKKANGYMRGTAALISAFIKRAAPQSAK